MISARHEIILYVHLYIILHVLFCKIVNRIRLYIKILHVRGTKGKTRIRINHRIRITMHSNELIVIRDSNNISINFYQLLKLITPSFLTDIRLTLITLIQEYARVDNIKCKIKLR